MSLFKLHEKFIGIDLGTSSTIMIIADKGILKSESSIVAIENKTKKIVAIGNEAKEMLGKTPEKISALMPMQQGGIADLTAMEMIIRRLIKELQEKENIKRPKVLINTHIGMNEVEQRAILRLLKDMGIKDICFVEETLASAIGAGINVDKNEASMMVNIGGGTSEVAVVALGKITACDFVKVAGDDFDNDIIEYIKKNMLVVIGKNTAEEIKKTIATVSPKISQKMEVTGRDLRTGLPKSIVVDSFQIHDAIKNSLEKIIEVIRETLDRTPPELLLDVQSNGIILSGGGALIEDIDKLISKRLKIEVRIAEDPLNCTAKGINTILNNDVKLKELIKKRRK